MVSDVIQIGDKVNLLKVKKKQEDDVTIEYVSQVLEFTEDNKIKIAMPIQNGRVIPLNVDEQYYMRFYSKKGLYQCKGVILDRYKEENVFILIVRYISDLEKFQRREYYRLEHILDINYRVVTREEEIYEKWIREDQFDRPEDRKECIEKLKILQAAWEPATITDISGGGARFNSMHPTDPEKKIVIAFLFYVNGKGYDYRLKAVVISCEPLVNRQGVYENRVKFIELELEKRETLIKFIFEEERKIRKKKRE